MDPFLKASFKGSQLSLLDYERRPRDCNPPQNGHHSHRASCPCHCGGRGGGKTEDQTSDWTDYYVPSSWHRLLEDTERGFLHGHQSRTLFLPSVLLLGAPTAALTESLRRPSSSSLPLHLPRHESFAVLHLQL